MYSAVRQGGRRLHQLARRGEVVERTPRPIRVDRFALLAFDPPRATFEVECSKGTYVRSLVADLGTRLGCGAHLTRLRRTRSGRLDLSMAVQLHEITDEVANTRMLSPAAAVAHLATAQVPEQWREAVANGRQIAWEAVAGADPPPVGPCALLSAKGRLLAIAHVAGGRLEYARVLTYGLT
jgi:tRNA pseudouridine55 synthase